MKHECAVVDPAAELGDNVEIGPFAVIEAHAVVGDGCRIGPGAVVHSHARLGPRTHLHAGAIVGGAPQDLAFDLDAVSYVEVGADCHIREGVTIHRGTKPETVTRLGDRCFLMANSHVAHNCQLGNDVIMANNALLGGYVEVADGAFISGNAVVHQFCRIGRLAMLSGLSGASKDVPPFCILLNMESNLLAGLNVVGMRRAGLGAEERKAVKKVYQILFRQNLNIKQALEQVREEFSEGPAAELWKFVEASKRGVCAARQDLSS